MNYITKPEELLNIIKIAFMVIISLIFFISASITFGQSVESSENDTKIVLDDTPWISTRANAMGGAISSLSDGMDAPHYNPAGIGGIHQKDDAPTVRMLNVPFLAASINENSSDLRKQLIEDNNDSDSAITSAILDANKDKRQYARVSFIPSIVVNRFMVSYIYDLQAAAVSQGSETGLVDTHYRATSGIGYGFSVGDRKGKLYLGAFFTHLQREETKGAFDYVSIDNRDLRRNLIKDNKKKYRGSASNVGLIWKIADKAMPTLGIVARDIGDTRYDSSEDGVDTIIVEEDISISFSVSPRIKKWMYLNFSIEGSDLTDHDTSLQKKLKTGLELTFGRNWGYRALAGIRTGYNNAGVSYGIFANIGLIGIQASSHAVDIGIDNDRLIERRTSAVFSVNIGEY